MRFQYLPMSHAPEGDHVIGQPQLTPEAAYALIVQHAAGRAVQPLRGVPTTGSLAEDVAVFGVEDSQEEVYSLRALLLPV